MTVYCRDNGHTKKTGTWNKNNDSKNKWYVFVNCFFILIIAFVIVSNIFVSNSIVTHKIVVQELNNNFSSTSESVEKNGEISNNLDNLLAYARANGMVENTGRDTLNTSNSINQVGLAR